MRMLPQNACLPILHLSPLFPPASFVVDGYIGLGATVPIGTDDLIQHFDRCEAITVYVDKVDSIQDGFIHYQLLHLCQATRLQYLNGHIDLANQNVRQQQHVRPKLPMPFLKRTRDAYKTWNQQDRAWAGM
jgi:hypothetical protein